MVMALVTVQLSSVDGGAEPTPLQEDAKNRRKRMQRRQSFVMVKGAALLLQFEEEPEEVKEPEPIQTAGPSEQQLHLQAMLRLLRAEDTLKLAVRLEPVRSCLTRYLLVVSSVGRTNEEQTILLGVDFPHDGSDGCTIGSVLPIWSNTQVFIDGDGGFSVTIGMDVRSFKPISVQTMWSLLQVLHKACEAAEFSNYIPGNFVHSGLAYYQDHRCSPQNCVNAWAATADLTSVRRDATTKGREENEKIIRRKLRDILRESDLENITSKQVRNALEQHTHCNLQDYTEFIDNEMIMILAQMDRPSEIFPYLYLGSEWNASNLEELQKNRVSHILNVTREIDNFFPETFKYVNIRVLDEESTNLLPYWKETHRFISAAKRQGTCVLVHCKMGVSRSASTVIAYAMKEYEWTLEQALKHVKERRSIVQPNAGFLRQLQTYQGILGASKQRHSYLWDPSSAPAISRYPSPPDSLANLPSAPKQKMNLRFLMRSISEMEVTDSSSESQDNPVERERSVSEDGSSQLEDFDTMGLEREDSLTNQLDDTVGPESEDSLAKQVDDTVGPESEDSLVKQVDDTVGPEREDSLANQLDDTVGPESEDSLANQLDSVSSMDDSLLETNDNSMDLDESIGEVHPGDPDGDLAKSSTKNSRKCTAMHEESTSMDEVFTPHSPSTRPQSSAARRRSRRKKKLMTQQPVENTRASLPSQSESVAGLQVAGLVSKRLQEVEQQGRKSRVMRQSNVGEVAEDS